MMCYYQRHEKCELTIAVLQVALTAKHVKLCACFLSALALRNLRK